MREIIQKVLAAEAEARRLVQEAQAEAERMVSDARKEARLKSEQANADARKEAQQILATAEMEAEAEKAGRLAQAHEDILSSIRLDEATAEAAVLATLRCICEPGSQSMPTVPAEGKSP